MSMPSSAVGQSSGVPPKRKRGRPPRRLSPFATCAREPHRRRQDSTFDKFDDSNVQQTSISRKHIAEESAGHQPIELHAPLDVENSRALVCPPAKIPCRHVERSLNTEAAGDDVTVESRRSDEDAVFSVGSTSTSFAVDSRQCNDAVDDERSECKMSRSACQPVIWVNPFVNSMLATSGLVCPFGMLDSAVFPNIQVVGLLAAPSFANDGAKIDGDVSCGTAIGVAGDHNQVYYPGLYGCLVSQDGDLSHAVAEGNPVCCITDFANETSTADAVALKTDRASHWRVRHETVEMQHFQAMVSDMPQLTMISNSSDNERYISVVDSLAATTMSCESNRLHAVRQWSQTSENMSVDSESAFLLVNDVAPAAATYLDVTELVEVSGMPAGCSDFGILADNNAVAKPDVIASNTPRYLLPIAEQQGLIEPAVTVTSSVDNPVPSEPLRRDSDASKDVADAVAGVSCSASAVARQMSDCTSDSQLSVGSPGPAASSSVSPRLFMANEEVGDGCCSSSMLESLVERPVECTVFTQEPFSEPFLYQSAALSTSAVASSSGLDKRCSPIEPAV
jgi:hypothetical protein